MTDDRVAYEVEATGTAHKFMRIWCEDCGWYTDIPVTCGDRLCPTCSRQRARRYRPYLRRRVKAIISTGGCARFLTLTVRNGTDLAERYQHLRDSFARLRERDIWDNVEGGAAVYEITRGRGGWHVHLHMIYDGEYIDKNQLSRAWKGCTGDSKIVDIRAIRESHGALSYLTKYATKPADSHEWTTTQRDEYRATMRGKRLYTTYGDWHGDKTTPRPSTCPKCGGRIVMDPEVSWIEGDEIEEEVVPPPSWG